MLGLSSTAKWYLLAAAVVAGLAGVGLIYAKGRLDAAHAAQLRDLQEDIKRADQRAEAERLARLADNQQAALDAAQQEALEAQIVELQDGLEDATRECLTGADTDRLRKLWGNP